MVCLPSVISPSSCTVQFLCFLLNITKGVWNCGEEYTDYVVPKSFCIVILARVGPKEPNGITPYQTLKHSLRVRREEVKVLVGLK